jgi:hypothetical protein
MKWDENKEFGFVDYVKMAERNFLQKKKKE